MQSQKLLFFVSGCLSALLLVSCGGMLVSDKPAEKTFWLNPYSGSRPDLAAADALELEWVFSVVPGLDTDRLLTLDPDAELSQFAAARWPDYLPEFAGSLLQRSIRDSGRFAKVSGGRSAANDNCVLELEAQKFYTEIDRNAVASVVQISMSGNFSCKGGDTPLELESRVAVSGQQIADIVSAHQKAMDQLTRSLLIVIDASLSQSGAP